MYYTNLYNKLSEFGHHHQILFGVIVGLCVIMVSWCVEQILDLYVFPNKKLHGYLAAVVGGLTVLWVIQHFVLHVF